MNKRVLFFPICISMIAVLLSSNSRAGIISIQPTKDNSIYAENNARSNGVGQGIFVGRTLGSQGTTIRRGLVSFDVAGNVPAGSTINSVTLKLTRAIGGPSSGDDVLNLHRLLASWGEGTSFGVGKGAPATTNDATWNYRNYTSQLWTNLGGDFAGVSGTTTLDNTNNVFTFSSQSGLVSDVQNWLNSPATNNGWLLKYGDEGTLGTARMFVSREGAVSDRPTLTIDFTPVPEPNSLLILGAAALVASSYRSRRR